MSSRTTPQQLVEAALAASTADGQVTYVTDSSEANLRWASNSLTTNGAMRSSAASFASQSSCTDRPCTCRRSWK